MWLQMRAWKSIRADGITVVRGPPRWERDFPLDQTPGYEVHFLGEDGEFSMRRHVEAPNMAEAMAQVDERWPVPAWWLELRAEESGEAEGAAPEGAAPGPFGGGT